MVTEAHKKKMDSFVGFLHLLGTEAVHVPSVERAFDSLYTETTTPPIIPPTALAQLFFCKRQPVHGKRQLLHWLLLHCEQMQSLDPLLEGFTSYASFLDLSTSQGAFSVNTEQALRQLLEQYPATAQQGKFRLTARPRKLSQEEASLLCLELYRIFTLISSSKPSILMLTELATLFTELGNLTRTDDASLVPLAIKFVQSDLQKLSRFVGPLVGMFSLKLGDDLSCSLVKLYRSRSELESVLQVVAIQPLADRFGPMLVTDLLQQQAKQIHLPSNILREFTRIIHACKEEDITPAQKDTLKQIIRGMLSKEPSHEPVGSIMSTVCRRLIKLGEREAFVDMVRNIDMGFMGTAMRFLDCLLEFEELGSLRLDFARALLTSEVYAAGTAPTSYMMTAGLGKIYYKCTIQERFRLLHEIAIPLLETEMPVEATRRFLLQFITLPLINSEELTDEDDINDFQTGQFRVTPSAVCGELTPQEIATLRQAIVSSLATCNGVRDMIWLSVLCDCIALSEPQTPQELVCFSLQTLHETSLAFVQSPQLALQIKDLRVRLNCIYALSTRISVFYHHYDDEDFSQNAAEQCSVWLQTCLQQVYADFLQARCEHVSTVMNRSVEDCSRVCNLMALDSVRGALTEACQLVFQVASINMDILEQEEEVGEENENEDPEDEDNYDEDAEHDEDDDHLILLKIWFASKRKSKVTLYYATLRQLLGYSNRVRSRLSPETCAGLTNVVSRVYCHPSFTQQISQITDEAEKLLHAEQVRVLKFISEHSTEALGKRCLMAVCHNVLEKSSFTPSLDTLSSVWNLFASAVGGDPHWVIMFASALVQHLRAFPQQQQQQGINYAMLVQSCMSGDAIMVCSSAVFDVISLLLPVGDVVQLLENVQHEHASILALCKHMFQLDTATEQDRIKLVEFALSRIPKSKLQGREWIQWIDSVAFPCENRVPTEAAEDEAFAQLVSFIAAKKLALASPRVITPAAAGTVGGSNSALRQRSLHHQFMSRQIQDMMDDNGGSSSDEEFSIARQFQLLIDSSSAAAAAASFLHDDDDDDNDENDAGQQPYPIVTALGKDDDNGGDMDAATRHPEPPPFASLQDQIYQTTYPVLASLVPEFTRCAPCSNRKAFRCLQCSVEPLCAVCADVCHAGHELAFLPAFAASFQCGCAANCEGKSPRRNMQRLPVEYLQPLLLSKNLSSLLPPQQQPEDCTFALVSTKLHFDMTKGGSEVYRQDRAASPRRKLANAGNMFAVCEGNYVTVCDLAPQLCLVVTNSNKPVLFSPLREVLTQMASSSTSVLSSTDLGFHTTQVAFSPDARYLLVAGEHQVVCMQVDGQTSQRKVCESTEPIKRVMWLDLNQICIVTASKIQIFSSDMSAAGPATYRAHGETLVDAALLEDDASLVLLCTSGCVLKHTVAPTVQRDEDLFLYNYVVFHTQPIMYQVSSITVIDSRTLLIHGSQGTWRVELDAEGENSIRNTLQLTHNHFDTSFPCCVLIDKRWIAAPSCSTKLASSVCFTDVTTQRTVTPENSLTSGTDRIVGLVDWNMRGERIVALLQSGALIVYWAKPNFSVDTTDQVPSLTLFQHLTLEQTPTIWAKSAYNSATGSPVVSPAETLALLTSTTNQTAVLTCPGREFEINIGLLHTERTICGLQLTFGMENIPKRVSVFNRFIALQMKHAALDNLNLSACVQLVLTRAELAMVRETKALRVRLHSGGPTTVSVKSIEVYSIDTLQIDLLLPQPGRFDFNTQGHIAHLRDMDTLRDAGRAALRFPYAHSRLQQQLLVAQTRDEVLAQLALAKLGGSQQVAAAARTLFNNPGMQQVTCSALLALFHATITKPKESSVLVHDAYSCDSCVDFPIRTSRLNCTACVDFDLCEDCFHRVPMAHNAEHPLQRVPIVEEAAKFCYNCGLVNSDAEEQLCAMCKQMGVHAPQTPTNNVLARSEDVAQALLAAGDVQCLAELEFIVLSCRICNNHNVKPMIKQRVAAVPNLTLKLECMAMCEQHLPGMFTEMEVQHMLDMCLKLPPPHQQAFSLCVDLCWHSQMKTENMLHTFKQLFALCFAEVNTEARRKAFSLMKHGFHCKDTYAAVAKSCQLAGLIAQLIAKAETLVQQQQRSTVMDCFKLVLELKQANASPAFWSVLQFDRSQFAAALMDCAMTFYSLKMDCTACVQLLREDFPLSPQAVRFLLDTCLMHATNSELRQASLTVLSESKQVTAAMLHDQVQLALSTTSSLCVEALLLFASKHEQNNAAVAVSVLQQLKPLAPRWTSNNELQFCPATEKIPAASLLFTLPRICLDCNPHMEQGFVHTSFEQMKSSFETNTVLYKSSSMLDFKSVAVEFTLHPTGMPSFAISRSSPTGTGKSNAVIQEISVYVSNKFTGKLTNFTQAGKVFTAALDLGPFVPHGNEIRFEFLLNKNALVDQRCPRCTKAVSTGSGEVTCSNCGEMLNQCRQCRTINYGDPKTSLLCKQCGFCRLGKLTFTAQTRASVGKCCVLSTQAEFDRSKQTLWDVASRNERMQFDRLVKSRQSALQYLEHHDLLRFAQELEAGGELEQKYTAAYFAALETHAIKEAMLQFQCRGNLKQQFALRAANRTGECLQCELAYQLALFTVVCKLDVQPEELARLLNLAQQLDQFQRFFPKKFHGILPFVDLVAAQPARLLQPAIDLLCGKRSAFSVTQLEKLARVLPSVDDSTLVLGALESFIRNGVQVEASISVLKRFAMQPPQLQPTLSPVVKRMRCSSE